MNGHVYAARPRPFTSLPEERRLTGNTGTGNTEHHHYGRNVPVHCSRYLICDFPLISPGLPVLALNQHNHVTRKHINAQMRKNFQQQMRSLGTHKIFKVPRFYYIAPATTRSLVGKGMVSIRFMSSLRGQLQLSCRQPSCWLATGIPMGPSGAFESVPSDVHQPSFLFPLPIRLDLDL